MTFTDYVEDSKQKRRERISLQPDDGAVLMAVKVLSRLCFVNVWHDHIFCRMLFIFDNLICAVVGAACWICRRKQRIFHKEELPSSFCDYFARYDSHDAGARHRLAIDLYMVTVTVILAVSFTVAFTWIEDWDDSTWCLAGSLHDANWAIPFVILSAIISLYRMLELFFFIALLHGDPQYSPNKLIRAVINTVWHYAEVTIAFATSYVCASVWTKDSFVKETTDQFLSCAWNPIYFSFVTITTLGYGDFSPQKWLGKTLVIIQVLMGFFLLIVVLQRAIALGEGQRNSDQNPGAGNIETRP